MKTETQQHDELGVAIFILVAMLFNVLFVTYASKIVPLLSATLFILLLYGEGRLVNLMFSNDTDG